MKSISAVIIVKNNPIHLFETLDSINSLVNEIIIGNIDIGNGYKKKLLQNKKIRLVDLPSDIPFADLIKEDLKKIAKCEFILYLDPDEIFPDLNKEKFVKLLDNYDFFYFPRKNIIFGKWIEHSRWWPDYQLRLFKINSVIWPKQIHPVPQTKGKEFRFDSKSEYAIEHYNYDSIDQYLEKAIRYAKSEAQARDKYSLSEAMKNSISEFISRYFAGEGYKDGMHGFVLSILQMFYYFLVYFYFWERKKYTDLEKDLPEKIQQFTSDLNYETNYWLNNKNLAPSEKKFKLKIKNKISSLLK